MLRKILSHIPFVKGYIARKEASEGLGKVQEALDAGNAAEAEKLLRETALTEKPTTRYVIGIPFMITSDGVKIIDVVHYDYALLSRFTPEQNDKMFALVDRLLENPTPAAIKLLADMRRGVMDTGPYATEEKAWNRIVKKIPEIMTQDVEKGFEAVALLHNGRYMLTMDQWAELRGFKEANIERLIEKNHAEGMGKLSNLIMENRHADNVVKLFEQYAEDPAISTNAVLWSALAAQKIDWNAKQAGKPFVSDEFSAATQEKLWNRLSNTFAIADDKADEGIRNIYSTLYAVEEWLPRPDAEVYPMHKMAEKAVQMMRGQLRSYFTKLAEKDPSAAMDRFIATAADFEKKPVYLSNIVSGDTFDNSRGALPQTQDAMLDGFDAVANYIGGHVENDAEALALIDRVAGAKALPEGVRDHAKKTAAHWRQQMAPK